jgi:glycosyltransferase involved in cell wall biosynthesis
VRLVALVRAPDHVCCRYRVAAFRPWLEMAGHSVELVPLPRSWPRRWLLFRRLRGANVLIQRQLLPAWQLARLRASADRLLFDFDDAVFLRDSYAAEGPHDPRKLQRFVATMRACDAVVAGNAFLAEHAALYADPQRVHVIPTCIDEARYPATKPGGLRPVLEGWQAGSPAANDRGDGKELVWIGSSSTLQGIERIAPLLERLGEEFPGLRLKVICDRFPTFRHLPVVRVPWREASEAADLASGDVGISWVPDDLWSRGKCGLKLLQYMAAGLPLITNPVGVHRDIVLDGETGCLATTSEEWAGAVRLLCHDADRRREMGRAGRRRLEAGYSVRVGAQRWVELLAQLERSPASRAGGAA